MMFYNRKRCFKKGKGCSKTEKDVLKQENDVLKEEIWSCPGTSRRTSRPVETLGSKHQCKEKMDNLPTGTSPM